MIGSRFGYVWEVGYQNYPLGLRDWRSLMETDGDPLLRLQLSKLEVNSNLHICNCHAKRQLKLTSQYTSISNLPLLTWKWHFTEGKRNIMTFLHVLSFLIIGFIITFGTVILLGKPAPLISFWKECDGYEWRKDCTPGIPSDSCVN